MLLSSNISSIHLLRLLHGTDFWSLFFTYFRCGTRASNFASRHNIPISYGSYQDLIDDPDIDVVYIGTIADHHAELAEKCLLAKKPTVVEKPVTLTYKDTKRLVDLARQQQVFFMEGMWTRMFPAMQKVRELITKGEIGRPIVVSGDFGWDTNDCDGQHRIWFPSSGGLIYDVAMYMSQLGLATFENDSFYRTVAMGTKKQMYPQTGPVDFTTLVSCQFERNRDGFLQFYVTGEANTEERAVIQGTEGRIVIEVHHIPCVITLYKEKGRTETTISQNGDNVQEFVFPFPDGSFTTWNNPSSICFTYQIKEVGRALRKGEVECPHYTWRETLDVSKMIETIRSQILSENHHR